jgi:hypothetical protein
MAIKKLVALQANLLALPFFSWKGNSKKKKKSQPSNIIVLNDIIYGFSFIVSHAHFTDIL